MSQTDQYKMYSLTEAAKLMHLGKDTLYRLIAEGKIGTIRIGRREKISASEIGKFQTESVRRRATEKPSKDILIPEKTEKSKSKSLFRALKLEILNGKCI